jgi:hypothetical protein
MSRILQLVLELQDEVVISATSATDGPHRSLDYLPGSVLLGAAAARLFPQWKTAQPQWPWTAFFSGQVRFGCAVPASPDWSPCRPVPLSFHVPKDPDAKQNAAPRNHAVKPWDANNDSQVKQLREGWLRPGEVEPLHVPQTHRMKTAMDPEKFDRPRDNAFFGYSSLTAGSLFVASVEADDTVDDNLWTELCAGFPVGQVLRLGRSRTAEYGRAIIRRAQSLQPNAEPVELDPCDGRVFVFAQADLALQDEQGRPSLDPVHLARDLGWQDAVTPDPDRTFLRIRSYSPYNRHRNHAEMERQVLRAGSVVAFKLKDNCKVQAKPWDWVGRYRSDGLGRVEIHPDWLCHAHAKGPPAQGTGTALDTAAVPTPAGAPAALPANAPLALRVMLRRHQDAQLQVLATVVAHTWKDDWKNARGVRLSQWRRLAEVATAATSLKSLVDVDLNDSQKGLFQHGVAADRQWKKEVRGRSAAQRVVSALQDKALLTKKLDEAHLDPKQYLDRLARQACREAAALTAAALQKGAAE